MEFDISISWPSICSLIMALLCSRSIICAPNPMWLAQEQPLLSSFKEGVQKCILLLFFLHYGVKRLIVYFYIRNKILQIAFCLSLFTHWQSIPGRMKYQIAHTRNRIHNFQMMLPYFLVMLLTTNIKKWICTNNCPIS